MDVVGTRAHLRKGHRIETPILLRPTNHCVQRDRAGDVALELPLLHASVGDDDPRGLVGVFRGHVPIEHVGRLDHMVVDADQNHVVKLHREFPRVVYSLTFILAHCGLDDVSATTSVQLAVRTAAEIHGARPALRLGEHVQSFAETHERALRLAGALESIGCGPGSRVGIMATNGPWFVELYIAVCEAGMIEVPVNLRFTTAELSSYLNHVNPDVIIATPDLAASAREIQTNVSSVRTTIGVGDGHGLEHDYEEALALATPSERPLRDPDETVLVCSTSGTSGNAKAVQHTQRTTATGYQPLIDRFEVDDDVAHRHWITDVLRHCLLRMDHELRRRRGNSR